jgi:ABC-type transport system involved in cytochrome bd biosynthesis fused ATPase/permease subunit
MSHDKIKAAARERMTRTGEPYATARREVVAEIRAAAAAHEELGPEYSDAVVASFLNRVEEEIAARVEARMAGASQPEAPRREAQAIEDSRRALWRGLAIGIVIGGILVSAIGGNATEHKHRIVLILLVCVVVYAAVSTIRQVRGALRRPAAPSARAGRTEP